MALSLSISCLINTNISTNKSNKIWEEDPNITLYYQNNHRTVFVGDKISFEDKSKFSPNNEYDVIDVDWKFGEIKLLDENNKEVVESLYWPNSHYYRKLNILNK